MEKTKIALSPPRPLGHPSLGIIHRQLLPRQPRHGAHQYLQQLEVQTPPAYHQRDPSIQHRYNKPDFFYFNPFKTNILKITHDKFVFSKTSPFDRAKAV
jgi:hypothetical protein